MDDTYQINVAKTDFREGYERADVAQLLSVFDDNVIDMSEGYPSKSGDAVLSSLRERATKLFEEYSVKLAVIIYEIVVAGGIAYDYGRHEFTLTPKSGGEVIQKRQRYFELWERAPSGQWKISLFVDNSDVRDQLGGYMSHWFLANDQESNENPAPR